MIAGAAALFLGMAGLADISRRNQSRLLLGHYRQIFEGHDLAWATEFLRRIDASGNARLLMFTQRGFKIWFRDQIIAHGLDQDDALERANAKLRDATIWLTFPVFYKDEDNASRLVKSVGRATEFRIQDVKVGSWVKSPALLQLKVIPANKLHFFAKRTSKHRNYLSPRITFGDNP